MNDGLGAAFEDFSRAMFAMLASPWTPWISGIAVLLTALIGVGCDVGQHPATGPMAQFALVLWMSCGLARATRETGARRWSQVALALGSTLILLGADAAGGRAGVLEVGGSRPTEAYTRTLNGQEAPVHLGSPLAYTTRDDHIELRLGLGSQVLGSASVPVGSRGLTAVGPWSLWVHEMAPGTEVDQVTLLAQPRGAEEAKPVEITLQAPGTKTIAEGVTITVERVSPDYGNRLGAAARVRMDWSEGETERSEVTWLFLEHPDLDGRVGVTPWALTLKRLQSTPKMILGVQRTGAGYTLAAAGWVLLLCAVGLAFKREEALA
ncbi:MAG: hypothetical protein ACE366_07025 [Bradymonadia bacterium]